MSTYFERTIAALPRLVAPARWLAAPLILAAGCGDPLVDGDYPGVPLLELAGTIVFASVEEIQDARGQLRLALFWLHEPSSVAPDEAVTELADQRVTISGLPGAYALRSYVPPPPAVRRELPGIGGELAIASILLYVDIDEDGAWSPGVDWLVGGSRSDVVVWAAEPLVLDEVTLDAGYHTVGIVRSPETGLTQCGTPIEGLASLAGVDGEVGLVIGLLHDVLVDETCDQRADEYAICPPPPHIVELCGGMATLPERCLPWAHCAAW